MLQKEGRQMDKRFDTIGIHERPHLDEITAIWLLRNFGEEKFPGIKTATLKYWTKSPDVRKAEDYERDGVILIGIGGGRFDEHTGLNGKRKEGECATTLVAKALGIENDPCLEKILSFVANSDLKAVGQPFDLAYITKILHQQYHDTPEDVIAWVTTGIEAKYYEQDRFWNSTKAEFEKTAKVEEIRGPGNKLFKMTSFVSDDEQMSKFARSVHGGRAAIIVQKCSKGNVQIFTNKNLGLTLYDVAQLIRIEEQRAKGRIVTTNWKILGSEGRVAGAEEWYFHESGQMLLNGSLTSKDVPPTRLSFNEIKEIVQVGIDIDQFQSGRFRACRQGFCSSNSSDLCPWFIYGLERCRLIRREMASNRKS